MVSASASVSRSKDFFIQLIIIRSCKDATMLSIPGSCIAKAFKYAVDGYVPVKFLNSSGKENKKASV